MPPFTSAETAGLLADAGSGAMGEALIEARLKEIGLSGYAGVVPRNLRFLATAARD